MSNHLSQQHCPLENTSTFAEEKPNIPSTIPPTNADTLFEAQTYLHLFSHEQNHSLLDIQRLADVTHEIQQTGTYRQTDEELVYGAKVAWRNNTRCIGRLFWKNLLVRDMRHLTTAKDVFQALVEHLFIATNKGKLKPVTTIFAQQLPGQEGIRIWNPQLIRYAGYKQADGTILGDPLTVSLTEQIRRLGWQGGAMTPFDVLPLVVQMPGQQPQLFELPSESVLEVPFSHPEYAWFTELGLKWHALPAISDMSLDLAGIRYTAAPFNGWYMGAEIGARNFGDERRYNLLPLIAKKMGLATNSTRTLWKDRALIELNVAVLHSFAQQGVTIVDHHTAAQQFIQHERQEKAVGRRTPADWGWIVPPLSGSTMPVFHCEYENTIDKPNFFAQPLPY